MEDQLFQPLLPTTSSNSSSITISSTLNDTVDNSINSFLSNSSIVLRLVTIISFCVISLWANYEASKGFDITIINDINDTPRGKHFTLFYISSDDAIRTIQTTSSIVENILYPNSNYTKKKVNRVTLRLASSTNRTDSATVTTNENRTEFVINIIVDIENLDSEIRSMILQGMARVWIWDGKPMAPSWIIDGLVEYIKMKGDIRGFGQVLDHFCLGEKYKDPIYVAKVLEYYQTVRKEFIQRLNQGLKNGWDNFTVDDALGMPAKNVCGSFGNSSKVFSI